MKTIKSRIYNLLFIGLFFLLLPAVIPAQAEEDSPAPPPIAPPLIREGAFAIRLGEVLSLGASQDEIEAENKLSEIGILPKNGWMADYPVTPDIIGELHEAIGSAAEAQKLPMAKEEALKQLNNAVAEVNLSIAPSNVAKQIEAVPPGYDDYPDPTVVNNYYGSEGPPVFTYYAPPPAYNYLYDWVAYPFWWTNVWFPGYFILHDFHRTIFINRSPVFVSNHFRDVRSNRFYRVDPVARWGGRTGFGISHRGSFASPGLPRGGGTVHSGYPAPGYSGRAINPPHYGGGAMANPGNRYPAPTASYPRSRFMAPPPQGARTFTPTSYGGGPISRPSFSGTSSPSYSRGGSFGGHSFGGGASRSSSFSGGMSGRSSFGGHGSSGRGRGR